MKPNRMTFKAQVLAATMAVLASCSTFALTVFVPLVLNSGMA
jgi:hypothetical protein